MLRVVLGGDRAGFILANVDFGLERHCGCQAGLTGDVDSSEVAVFVGFDLDFERDSSFCVGSVGIDDVTQHFFECVVEAFYDGAVG